MPQRLIYHLNFWRIISLYPNLHHHFVPVRGMWVQPYFSEQSKLGTMLKWTGFCGSIRPWLKLCPAKGSRENGHAYKQILEKCNPLLPSLTGTYHTCFGGLEGPAFDKARVA